jgi:hypothetical protein
LSVWAGYFVLIAAFSPPAASLHFVFFNANFSFGAFRAKSNEMQRRTTKKSKNNDHGFLP